MSRKVNKYFQVEKVKDAKNRWMTQNIFNMLGEPIYTENIDSGRRWQLTDTTQKPIHQWDNQHRQTTSKYDTLQRPINESLRHSVSAVKKTQETIYGTSSTNNNKGQLIEQYDQSGKTTINTYDFKGNTLSLAKQMAADYKNILDWDNNPALQTETFTQSFVYDAMNRPVQLTKPDSTLEEYTYNKAGLLETIKAKIRGAASFTNFVSNINYNEKGQRTEIYYGNNTKTKYEYDAETFRLTRLLTTRNAGADKLQDINYTYDPVGNITEVVDAAQQTHYFNNTATTASGIYTYDALYRLKTATGRELTSLQLPSNTDFVDNIALPNTAANAMQNYTQQFSYDELGNIIQLKSVNDWIRNYIYDTDTNQLLRHTGSTNTYTYDSHGNMLSMPHLSSMIWDYKDELKEVTLNASGDKAYYVYDSGGERVRKIIEKTGGVIEERIYLGGYEVYRKTVSGVLDFERETLHVSDDTKKIVSVETKTVENASDISSPVSNIRYQYDNHLGSASLELDDTAAIISYEEYHPFGTTSYRSGRTETEVSLKRYKYVGKERDEETGLYYYGARYYAAWICRFISVDPLQFEYPQLTPYNYAGNKPITYIDIDGMQAEGDNPIKADNTNVVSQPINLDKFKPSTAANFLVSGVKQPEPYTIGAYNPTGMSDEFLHTRSDQIKGQNKFDELLYKHQERSPLMFGNPGQPHGAGLYSSLEKGAEIYGAIEGGAGLLKFGSFGLRLAKFGLKASIPQIAKGTLKGMGYTKELLI